MTEVKSLPFTYAQCSYQAIDKKCGASTMPCTSRLQRTSPPLPCVVSGMSPLPHVALGAASIHGSPSPSNGSLGTISPPSLVPPPVPPLTIPPSPLVPPVPTT